MPFSRAAPSFTPTDSVYSRSVVKRKISARSIPTRITPKMGVGTGIPGMVMPMALMIGLSTWGVALPTIQ